VYLAGGVGSANLCGFIAAAILKRKGRFNRDGAALVNGSYGLLKFDRVPRSTVLEVSCPHMPVDSPKDPNPCKSVTNVD
jgi:hypothetical protein